MKAGDQCAVRPFLNDPDSRASRRGRVNCCESLRVLGVHIDGGMGDLLTVPTRFLHPVPGLALRSWRSSSRSASAATPSRGRAFAGRRRAGNWRRADRARLGAVCGAVGRAGDGGRSLGTASRAGAPADAHRERRDDVESGLRFDCVFDATGSAASMMKAFDFVAAGGRLVFVGLTLDPITFVDPELHRREMTLSRAATPHPPISRG